MKKGTFFIFLLLLLGDTTLAFAQISHGGQPMPLSITKSTDETLYVEMPHFDLKDQLHQDSLEAQGLKSGFRFAYKFITDYTPENSGIHFTTADGTRVWRLGIHSANAYSINLLFSKYELPKGASLFLYNANQTQVIGSFNYLNNSEKKLLPIRPIDGDRVIIEYQEPKDVAFHGVLQVGEVNHGYRDLRAYKEPQPSWNSFKCMNPLSFYQKQTTQYDNIARSVVLMIIDGGVLCTGSLINNTANDKKPYILTASHCLNDSFDVENPDYESVAGSIVFFFNYETPTTSTDFLGTEEMSMASSHFRAANKATDMALLELTETPPVYYRPYYSGWNAQDAGNAPYAGIHHPRGSVKRVNIADSIPTLQNFFTNIYGFNDNNFWYISKWLSGNTTGGSSGSPLFDANNRIIGALTGGNPEASCSHPIDDYYYALKQSWTISENTNKQLKHWLNPDKNNNILLCDGLDPYESNSCYRLSNIRNNGDIDSIEIATKSTDTKEYLFGTNSTNTSEYAECYKVNGDVRIYGSYIVCPYIYSLSEIKVEINVYDNVNGKPGNILHSELFNPAVLYRSTTDSTFQTMSKDLNKDTESFIPFSSEVYATNTFFIGYKIKTTKGALFTVYSLKKTRTTQNTSWVKYNDNWIEAAKYSPIGYATSLYIDPVIQYTIKTDSKSIVTPPNIHITLGSEKQTVQVFLPENPRQSRAYLISLDGKLMQAWTLNEQVSTLRLKTVNPGVYIIRVSYNRKTYTQKIIL